MTIPDDEPAPDADGTKKQEQAHPPLYPNVQTWVEHYFTRMFLHRVPDNPRVRWCPQWWQHAEAIARLTILWNTWEAARWQPSAKPAWWLDCDHHLPLLLGLDGPLRNCRTNQGDRDGRHQPEEAPVLDIAPPWWWD